jgi:hypothetical protein
MYARLLEERRRGRRVHDASEKTKDGYTQGLGSTATGSLSLESTSVFAQTTDDPTTLTGKEIADASRPNDAAMFGHNERYSRDELCRMDSALDFLIPSESRLRQITRDVAERFRREGYQTLSVEYASAWMRKSAQFIALWMNVWNR